MLKDNKQVFLGFVIALVLCTFFKKDLVEGFQMCSNRSCVEHADSRSPGRLQWDTKEECKQGGCRAIGVH